MYDELVKALRICEDGEHCDLCQKWDDKQNGGMNVCQTALCKEAADAIEELNCNYQLALGSMKKEYKRANEAEKQKPRWIPVTERLPEEHVFVLIRQEDDRMMVAVRVDGDWWYRYFAYDVDRWDENEQGTITHWMPLPQPPKEET